jgi:hypothetical protein
VRVSRLIAVVLFVTSLPASATEPTAEHRAALTRYLTASRTHVVTRHFALPISIRQAAIERWGFDHVTLGVDAILAMEAQVDEAALESTVLALHARHLSADVLSAAADFYESDVGRRLLRALVGSLLPSTDPLFQEKPSPPTPDDQRAFEAFIRTPAGQQLKAIEARVTAELLQTIAATADRAVGDYVRVKGLPNKRRDH